MAAFNVRERLLPGFDTVEEVSLVPSVIAHRISGLVLHVLSPLLRFLRIQFGFQLRSADRVASWQYFCDQVIRVHFGITRNLKPEPRHRQRSACAVEQETAHALATAAGRAFAVL